MIISGWINIIMNVIYCFAVNNFTDINWFDKHGNMRTIHIKAGFLVLMAVSKIICGLLYIKQGRSTHKIFKPILKEYKDAQLGITQGIPMNERKSEKMKPLKREIKKITLAMIFVLFVVCGLVRNELVEVTDDVI
jgi:hypothetical protein